MKELIKIQTNEVGENCISARELHEGLKIKSKFNDWMTNRIKKYGFEEKIDFILVTKEKKLIILRIQLQNNMIILLQ